MAGTGTGPQRPRAPGAHRRRLDAKTARALPSKENCREAAVTGKQPLQGSSPRRQKMRVQVDVPVPTAALKLPSNRHSIGNMEELRKSLMDSLDMTEVCHNLMEDPKATSPKSATPALRKSKSREYLVCLQCRRCVTSSCPHCSEPEEQQDLPVLVVILHGYYMEVAKGQLVEMKPELKFELVIGGKPVYTWQKDHLL